MALIRGSNAEASRQMPEPYDAPPAPMCAGSAAVLARSQSITADTSDTSFGPPVSIWPPDPQKPLVVYDRTTYPRLANADAWIMYSASLRPQLLANTIAGRRAGGVGAVTLALSTTPSRAEMSTKRKSVVEPLASAVFTRAPRPAAGTAEATVTAAASTVVRVVARRADSTAERRCAIDASREPGSYRVVT